MNRAAILLILALGACREDVTAIAPDPIAMTDEALGHFCQMSLADMDGPKSQIHLAGMPDPIFFAQVRDAVAYLKEPDKPAEIAAFYVSDLSQAPSWEHPGPGNWVAAADAFYVVGGAVTGGMGAPELAPFSLEADAQVFAKDHGGTVMRLAGIPAEAVLGAVETVELEGAD